MTLWERLDLALGRVELMRSMLHRGDLSHLDPNGPLAEMVDRWLEDLEGLLANLGADPLHRYPGGAGGRVWPPV